MFPISLPLTLLLWPLTLAFGQTLLTPPPVSASGSASSSIQISSAQPSASVSASGSSVNASSSSPSQTSSALFPSLSGYSSCVVQCLGLTISAAGCSSIVDVQCFCHNATVFTSGLVDCISQQCPSDLSAAESVSQQFCNVASPSTSLSFPTPSLSPSSSQPSSSSGSASLHPSSSGLLSNASSIVTPTPSATQSSTPNSALQTGHSLGLNGLVILAAFMLAYSFVLGR